MSVVVEVGLEQVGSLRPGPSPVYTVKHRVYRATGIDPAVFVLYMVDGLFSHVAHVREMEELPDSRDTALECRSGFYRASEFSRDHRTLEMQQADASDVRRRVQVLTDEWRTRVTPGQFRDLHVITPEDARPDPGADT